MIRALIFSLLCALPATAQDFRGLVPGMPVSELTRLGEAYPGVREHDGISHLEFSLPGRRSLVVVHDQDRILLVSSLAPFERPERYQNDGLEFFRSNTAEVVGIAGSEGSYFETEGLYWHGTYYTEWRLYYELPEYPDVVLRLMLHDRDMELDVTTDEFGTIVINPRATLLSASLFHREYVATHPDYWGTTTIERPGAAPFALTLSEAFPSDATLQ